MLPGSLLLPEGDFHNAIFYIESKIIILSGVKGFFEQE
jgi:hypothetical protein